MTSATSTKRWDKTAMWAKGHKLFARIHKQKHYANPNHEVHFMARKLKEPKEQEVNWLTQGIESLINGSYTPGSVVGKNSSELAIHRATCMVS